MPKFLILLGKKLAYEITKLWVGLVSISPLDCYSQNLYECYATDFHHKPWFLFLAINNKRMAFVSAWGVSDT
jgi:hypothetical protein